jgi:hypothetical protein
MNPVTHFLAGWAVAQAPGLERRERAAIAIAGVIPDADGLGIVVDFFTRNSAHPTYWWGGFHHILGHNITFALICAAAAFFLAKQRWKTAVLAFLSFHLHILGDLAGARGPEGEQWAIPYLNPFSDRWQLVWSGQWALNAWPNFLITFLLLTAMFYFAWRRGYSPLEIFNRRADAAFITAIRQRFPLRTAEQ